MTGRRILTLLLAAFLSGALGALAFTHSRALLHCWSGLVLCLFWWIGPDLILLVLLPLERAIRPPRPLP